MKLYKRPLPMSPRKLNEMRRSLIMAFWVDLRLFGYRTESVISLQKRIQREKAK